MTSRHAGKFVLVTGGGSGIGLAIARRFHDEGATICLFDVSAEALDRARDALGGADKSNIETVVGSVSDKSEVERCFARLDEQWGRLDAVVNCAGILVVKPALELEEEAWRRVIDVNLTGTWLICQAAGKRMAAAGKGVHHQHILDNGKRRSSTARELLRLQGRRYRIDAESGSRMGALGRAGQFLGADRDPDRDGAEPD